ncbi:MAG TPA: hypothetical protein VGI46_06815 [Candidatus Acidoferrum sp.]|jgi:DNA-binding GntR family transcriptional regulator
MTVATIDHERALQRLEDARAAERQVAATARHNFTQEWADALEGCVAETKAAEAALAEMDYDAGRRGTS